MSLSCSTLVMFFSHVQLNLVVKGKTVTDELAPHEVDSLLGLLLLQLLLSVLSNEDALEAIKEEDELDLEY